MSHEAYFFDLDDTLTRSKTEIAPEMFYELLALARSVPVIVVSGATRQQIEKQIPHVSVLPRGMILAQNGNDATESGGAAFWHAALRDTEKQEILTHVRSAAERMGTPVNPATLEDRGCQISLSFVGHNAPREEKVRFDPDRSRRRELLAALPFRSMMCTVSIGGTTCLDYTRRGAQKGDNVRRLMEREGWRSALYVGDALVPGGNDESVIGVCDTRQVSGPRETASVIRELLGRSERTVAVSGYFNPVHRGHVALLEAARELGDRLVVILNNDLQVQVKGSVPFMSESERAAIISSLRAVDEVVISVDEDRTVRETLSRVRPHIFANGGDRASAADIPEARVCERLGIEMVFDVGGDKVQSSSWLIGTAAKHMRNTVIQDT
ncbi:MAG: HAD-IIB family hydrolase [bacterium]|nr:HAD-IIB family hydrolase [bacterium]MDZ4285252.1 HAD-IIB family hydrolase [Patescibacteria group bacterium]